MFLLHLALAAFLNRSFALVQDISAETEFQTALSEKQRGNPLKALEHLQRAIAIDPKMIKAHFAAASTADAWCGVDSDLCDVAIGAYKAVLELSPSNEDAIKNLAYALYTRDRLAESTKYYRQALSLRPRDPELLYSVGALAARTYQGEVPTGKPFIYSPSCPNVRKLNLARIEEGIDLLGDALQLQGPSTDVMGFLAALYSRRADIQCNDSAAYKSDFNAAKRWDRARWKLWKDKRGRSTFDKCPIAPPPMRPWR